AFSLVRFASVAESMLIGVLLFVCVRFRLCETGGKVFASSRPGAPRGARIIAMDAIDRKILALLQANGRMTFTELAAEVQLSVSRCQPRVREQRADGPTRDSRGVIDAKKFGPRFEVIALAPLADPDPIHAVHRAVEAGPEIVEADW